jgi:tRNA pseudouridine55 synthase
LQPRPIEILSLAVVRYEYPELELDVCCGSGTYIRSLGRDLAQSLGTGAVMSALQRMAVGDFRLAEAIAFEQLTPEAIADGLLSPRRAVALLPVAALTEDEIRRVAQGMTIGNRWDADADELAAVDEQDRLVAILAPRGREALGPVRNFPR